MCYYRRKPIWSKWPFGPWWPQIWPELKMIQIIPYWFIDELSNAFFRLLKCCFSFYSFWDNRDNRRFHEAFSTDLVPNLLGEVGVLPKMGQSFCEISLKCQGKNVKKCLSVERRKNANLLLIIYYLKCLFLDFFIIWIFYFLILKNGCILCSCVRSPETSCLLDCSDMVVNEVILQRCVAFFNGKNYNNLHTNAQQHHSSGEWPQTNCSMCAKYVSAFPQIKFQVIRLHPQFRGNT